MNSNFEQNRGASGGGGAAYGIPTYAMHKEASYTTHIQNIASNTLTYENMAGTLEYAAVFSQLGGLVPAVAGAAGQAAAYLCEEGIKYATGEEIGWKGKLFSSAVKYTIKAAPVLWVNPYTLPFHIGSGLFNAAGYQGFKWGAKFVSDTVLPYVSDTASPYVPETVSGGYQLLKDVVPETVSTFASKATSAVASFFAVETLETMLQGDDMDSGLSVAALISRTAIAGMGIKAVLSPVEEGGDSPAYRALQSASSYMWDMYQSFQSEDTGDILNVSESASIFHNTPVIGYHVGMNHSQNGTFESLSEETTYPLLTALGSIWHWSY